MGRSSFSEDMTEAWRVMGSRQKVLMVAQSVLSIVLILALVFDFTMGKSRVLFNRIELGIVIVLLLVSALRSYPEHKKTILLYLICMVVAVVCLVLSFVL